MASLQTIIAGSIQALSQVTPQTLTSDQLRSSIDTLENFNVNEAIDNYWEGLPSKPETDHDQPEWEKQVHKIGADLNHSLTAFNQELNRVKDMQAALKVPQLEEVIHAAQRVIRPIYSFTSQLT